jgi:hypothetical protein
MVSQEIGIGDAMGNPLANTNKLVFWSFTAETGCDADANAPSDPIGPTQIKCGPPVNTHTDHVFSVARPVDAMGLGVSPDNSAGRVQITAAQPLTMAHIGRTGDFKVSVSEAPNAVPECEWKYTVHVVGSGGGWGDPHITTVDGVHYDFQSAGEFTALRQKLFEVQTRQTAVPTTHVPGPNSYTGLSSCVAIYTAVAARVGSNRVTLQPEINGRPDPSGMQLRVNGELVTLTSQGIDLFSVASGRLGLLAPTRQLEGRIIRSGTNGIEIVDTRGTQLVVTPAWWPSQQTWYLDLNIYQTSATEGIWGRLAADSWLPALPDGKSLGPKPAYLKQRYLDLYETFADAWRVTDKTSLFDYAPGTDTSTFTLDEWPRYKPTSCELEGEKSVEPAPQDVAENACGGIVDKARRADCVFDVMVTGHTGFAETHQAMQEFRPHGSGWQPPLQSGKEPPRRWPWWWPPLK